MEEQRTKTLDGFKKIIGRQVASGKLSHAYIFEGEKGTGKKTIARYFAKMIQCESLREKINNKEVNSEEAKPCDRCTSCRRANENSHPDIIEIKTAFGKKSITVEDIRETLVNDMAITPYCSQYKIYIVENAQDMTPEAQNSLLKTLEEPPEYGIIMLLTTDKDLLLPTIKSRCEIFDIPKVSDEYLYEQLKARCPQAKESDILFAVEFAEGRLGKGIYALEDPNFKQIKKDVITALTSVKNMPANDIMKIVRQAAVYKDLENGMECYFDIMQLWVRDVIIFETTRDANKLVFKDELVDIDRQASAMGYDGVLDVMDAIDKAKIRLKANVSFDIVMQMLFVTIKENMHR